MGKCNCSEEKRLSYNQGFLEGREVGRFDGKKEGAIKEMRDTLTTLKAIDNMLDCNQSAEGLKLLIRIKEKRLKELEKVGEQK